MQIYMVSEDINNYVILLKILKTYNKLQFNII